MDTATEGVGWVTTAKRVAARRRPTMRDVAAVAGVSFKTVSRVVNGEPGVSDELVARVGQAVDELGFRPNAGASTLRRSSGKTHSIALLLQDVANPYSAVLLRTMGDVAREHGMVVLAASLDEQPSRERELTALFASRRADGLIIAPAADDQSHLAREMQAGMQVVFVDRAPRGLDADCVLTTNFSGAAEGVRHLAAHGHRQIAYLGDNHTITTAQERHAGYLAAMADSSLPVDPRLVVEGLRDTLSADGAVSRLMSAAQPPTALFCAQNLVTIGAIRALRRLSLHQRIAVVGFDDFLLADLLDPAVTVVAQDVAAIGRLAAQRLFARLDGDSSPHQALLVPTALVRRGSGEIRRPSA